MTRANDWHRNYWRDSAGPGPERPPATGRQDADIVIVGAGFTGLWTAYYLTTLAPERHIVVLEAETIGHGASGRNGGWAIGNLAGLDRLIGDLDSARRRAICAELADNVDQIGQVIADEAIDAEFHKGGAIEAAARYPEQIAVQKARRDALIEAGHAPEDCLWLDAAALAEQVQFRNGYGGVFFRHTASLHPARLVQGLARAVERRGVTIHEGTRVSDIAPGQVETANGARFRAGYVVQATEGYSESLAGLGRRLLAVESLVVATEPLCDDQWVDIGLAARPTFCDASRNINYGHRSQDGRLIFGARGVYRLGSPARHAHGISGADIAMRRRLLADLLPGLPKDIAITHGWGGTLGLSRRFRPHAIHDRARGLATAGGYAGEGVAASHLMARTLAELIVGCDTPRTRAPWAHDRVRTEDILRRWEPEPVRWLAARTISGSYRTEEALLQHGRGQRWPARWFDSANTFFASLIE